MLDDLRKKKDDEKSLKKKAALKSGKLGQSTLAFAGAQVLGFEGNTGMNQRDTGYHTEQRYGGNETMGQSQSSENFGQGG
jgi:hypothetical protein